jgi:hypothetical protein
LVAPVSTGACTLAKQAIRLFTTYVLGQGVSYHADDPDVQQALDASE